MVFIYVLKCSQGKYYVGKTTNPNYRLDSHFSEGGSAWTKKYNPISLYELIPDQTDHDEQRVYVKIWYRECKRWSLVSNKYI